MQEQSRATLISALERMFALSVYQSGLLRDAATALDVGNFNVRLLSSTLTPPEFARRLIVDRRARDAFFEVGMFADAAWDILLDLFAAHGESRRVMVSSLCIAAAVPPTTAIRYIAVLEERGMVQRARGTDASDNRRVYVAITSNAREMMLSYLLGVAHRWGINLVEA